MTEIGLAAAETVLQSVLFAAVALSLRSLGRMVTGRQLTFYKIYAANFSGLILSWALEFIRADQSLRRRWAHIVALGCYTTSIAVLFGSHLPRMSSVNAEVAFLGFFLAGTAAQLFFSDEQARPFRHFYFAPLSALMVLILIAGTQIALDMSRFPEALSRVYIGITFLPGIPAMIVSLAIALLFFAVAHARAGGWNRLTDDISELAFLAPILMFFFNEGLEPGWLTATLWAVKAA
ncbi:MAG TPA: hypothetical protein VFV50_18135, partial [Bdellovibrionales bacterium]|nr:hypothetical protein [Bdellovibrionales bacterium]